MNVLHVSLFGCIRVSHSDPTVVTGKLTRAIQSLLAYLLLERRRLHSREVLAGLFWSEHDAIRARNCLNTALWRLRHVLEPDGVPDGTYLVTSYQGDVGFNCASQHWLDVEVFEQRVEAMLNVPPQAATEQQTTELERALELYTGDLLEGFYADWALREREHQRRLLLNGLGYLMHAYRHQRVYEKGLRCGQRILDHDPLREDIHREVMCLYAESGQRSLALHQYELCCAALKDELDVEPLEETQHVYQHLLADSSIVSPPIGADPSAELAQVLNLFQQATHSFATAQQELYHAQQQLELLVRKQH